MSPIYSEELLLLEPVNTTATDILRWAKNPTAVHNYLACLERGWLGQALRERYSFDDSDDTPTGMMQGNSIEPDGTYTEWLKPVDDQIKEDLRDCIEENHECIPITRDTFVKALEKGDDPGRSLMLELVRMMEVGHEVCWHLAVFWDILTDSNSELCRASPHSSVEIMNQKNWT